MNNTITGSDMADRATVTFHTTPETKARLDRLATLTKRSKSFLTNAAVEQYLAAEEDFIGSVQDGLVAAEEGQFVDSSKLKADLHSRVDQIAKSSKRT